MTRFGILFVAVIMLFSGCGNEKEKRINGLTSHQKKVLSYLPAETQFIMYMNLNELRKTPFWQDYFTSVLQKSNGSSWLDEFEKETGSGIKSGVVEFITTGSWSGNDASILTFDKNLSAVKNYFVNNSKFKQSELLGKKFFQSKEGGSVKFYFANDSTLIMINSEAYLNDLIASEHKSLLDNKSLFPIIQSIQRGSQYWVATDEGGYASGLLQQLVSSYKKLPAKSLISSVKNITLAANFDEGVKIESEWGCEDTKSAYLLSAAIKGALAMDLLAGRDSALNELLQKMEVNHDKQNINFEINLNKNDLSELKSFAKKNQLDKKL